MDDTSAITTKVQVWPWLLLCWTHITYSILGQSMNMDNIHGNHWPETAQVTNQTIVSCRHTHTWTSHSWTVVLMWLKCWLIMKKSLVPLELTQKYSPTPLTHFVPSAAHLCIDFHCASRSEWSGPHPFIHLTGQTSKQIFNHESIYWCQQIKTCCYLRSYRVADEWSFSSYLSLDNNFDFYNKVYITT